MATPGGRSSDPRTVPTADDALALTSTCATTSARPLAQSLVLSRLATHPTVLPAHLAKLVTALSLAARVSLRTSALFLEAILEALQGTTVASLGVTRRALIAAVASARALHYVRGGLDWSGRDEHGNKTEDAFLAVLDKYTNLGIYLIHHTFTLAELFTMSSFYLTVNTVQTVSAAASESVRMLDSILGSNESSRALSSIISLVRHELTTSAHHDDQDHRGTLASLAALTKAITAFACLQTATHRRTLKELNLRVVYDCTVVVDHDATAFARDDLSAPPPPPPTTTTTREQQVLASSPAGPKRRKRRSGVDFDVGSDDDEDGGGVLTDVRSEYERLSRRGTPRAGRSRTTSKTTSVYGEDLVVVPCGGSRAPFEEDGGMATLEDGLQGFELRVPGEREIVDELDALVGLPEMTTSVTTDGFPSVEVWADDGRPLDESDLPEEVRQALREIEQGEGSGGGDHDDHDDEQQQQRSEKRVIRPKHGERGYSYEIEVEETTTTTTTTVRTVEEIEGGQTQIVARSTRDKDAPRDRRKKRSLDDDDGASDPDEAWIAVGGPSSRDEMDTDGDGRALPGSANGGNDLAVRSRKEALEDPVENRQRLKVVLSTMTKKFTQRKRTVRRVSDSREPSPSLPSPAASSPSSSPTIGWSRSRQDPVESLRNQVSTPPKPSVPPKPNSVFRALSKSFIRQGSSSPSTLVPNDVQDECSAPPPASTRAHERSISASSLAPPSALRPPSDLPPQPFPLPMSSTGAVTPPSGPALATPAFAASSSVTTTAARQHGSESGKRDEAERPDPTHFPRRHLVSNLQHFARYSSAAYGQSFLRILGLAKSEFKFPHTEIHANNHSFAHHVGIRVEDILLSSFTDPQPILSNEKISPIVNYVAVDHSVEAIVLSCRGSLGLSDILVDLTCDYEPMPVPEGDPHGSYLVHSGMFLSATTLQRGTVHDVIKDALERFPTYGLVLCGHSLGGGVAALLSILWSTPAAAYERQEDEMRSERRRPPPHPPIASAFVTSFSSGLAPGRAVACYTYGVPCVASPDLARYSEGLVISTVHNYDLVPTLSIGVLRDLKTMALGFYAETGVAEEIVARVVGLCQRRFVARRRRTAPSRSHYDDEDDEDRRRGMGPEALTDPSEESRLVPLSARELRRGKSENKALEPAYTDPSLLGPDTVADADDTELSDWLWSLRKTIRASSDSEKLYPPGTVYVVENYTVFVSSESSSEGRRGKYARREGRRVLLRAVDDVERRFSEPIFSRSMLSDHSPKSYETNCDLLAAAVL